MGECIIFVIVYNTVE